MNMWSGCLSCSVLGLCADWLMVTNHALDGFNPPLGRAPVGDVSSVTAIPNNRWFDIESVQKRAVVTASLAFILLRASSFITLQYKQQFAFYILKTVIHC